MTKTHFTMSRYSFLPASCETFFAFGEGKLSLWIIFRTKEIEIGIVRWWRHGGDKKKVLWNRILIKVENIFSSVKSVAGSLSNVLFSCQTAQRCLKGHGSNRSFMCHKKPYKLSSVYELSPLESNANAILALRLTYVTDDAMRGKLPRRNTIKEWFSKLRDGNIHVSFMLLHVSTWDATRGN